jgi:hypothetical protein
MATHRPLSPWIARPTADTGRLGPVNDGDDRVDARHMPSFGAGWMRTPLRWRGDTVLGLRHLDGASVIELDDCGSPITCSTESVGLIARIEDNWPVVDPPTVVAMAALRSEPLPLRYWLLERMEAEGDPPDAVFTVLPWELLDRALHEIGRAFTSGGVPGELVEIRHWLSPATEGITGPLEQFDHGLRTGEAEAVDHGATALLTNLRDLPLSRIPDPSRERLLEFVIRLGQNHPGLGDLAAAAAARLAAGGSSVPDVPGEVWLIDVAPTKVYGPGDRGEDADSGTLDFDGLPVSLLGPDVRGIVTRLDGELEVTITRFDPDHPPAVVAIDAPDARPTQLIRHGRVLTARLPWTESGLPARLVIRLASDGSQP